MALPVIAGNSCMQNMDIVASEARSPVERMTLENLLRSEEITVKEEPLITTCLVPDLQRFVKEELWARTPPPPSLKKIEVIDLIDDDDDNDDDQNYDHVGVNKTPQTPLVTNFLAVDLEEESRTTKFPPAFDSIEVKEEPVITTCLVPYLPRKGNAEPHHFTMKQLDVPNSIMHNASVHPSLTLVKTNSEVSIAQKQECCDPIQIDSKPSHTNRKSNTVQEPQCLGPFHSSLKCPKCSVTLTEYYEIIYHSCIIKYICREETKPELKCCFCKKEFSNANNLKGHIKRHVEKTYLKCSVCGVHLTSIKSFKAHALRHTN